MNNVINLCIKATGVILLCYFLNRIVQYCRGTPKAKTTGTLDQFNAEQKTLDNRTVAVPTLSEDQQRQAIIDSRDLILSNKASYEKVDIKLKELVDQMSSKNRSVQLEAMESLQSICKNCQNAQTAKSLIIQFTNFLTDIGPIDTKSLVVQNTKRELQSFVLGLLPELIKSYSKQAPENQDVKALDKLTICLIETYNNTSDAGKDSVLWTLSECDNCIQSIEPPYLENKIELLIAILNNKKEYKRIDESTVELLSNIMQKKLENLSKYTASVLEALKSYEKKKNEHDKKHAERIAELKKYEKLLETGLPS